VNLASLRTLIGDDIFADPDAQRFRILMSYHYWRDTNLDAFFAKHFGPPEHWPEVFADSGAFSAHTQGAEVNVDAYADWLHQWDHLFTVRANLDVIGDPEATWANQQRLEGRGCDVLPVFHTSEPWEWLDRYADGHDYIALGGMVGHRGQQKHLRRWIIEAFQRVEKRQPGKVGFHGFGLTAWPLMCDLPWRSVDSTRWLVGTQYGELHLWDADQPNGYLIARVGDSANCYDPTVAALIRLYGGNPDVLADRALYHRRYAVEISAVAWKMSELWLWRRHGRRWPRLYNASSSGTEFRQANAGLRLYLACSLHDAATGVDAVRQYLHQPEEAPVS